MRNKQQIIHRIDQALKTYMEKGLVPGLAIGVVLDQETVFLKGYGVKSIDTAEPVDENTLFHMAAVSKTFVATAIMQPQICLIVLGRSA